MWESHCGGHCDSSYFIVSSEMTAFLIYTELDQLRIAQKLFHLGVDSCVAHFHCKVDIRLT